MMRVELGASGRGVPRVPPGGSGAADISFGITGHGEVQGVDATPGWTVLEEGAFELDTTATAFHLDVMHFVSSPALTSRVRLWDLTAGAAVAGSTLSTSATTETRQQSADLAAAMTVGNIYQFQAECTGGSTASDFSIVRYAVLRRD